MISPIRGTGSTHSCRCRNLFMALWQNTNLTTGQVQAWREGMQNWFKQMELHQGRLSSQRCRKVFGEYAPVNKAMFIQSWVLLISLMLSNIHLWHQCLTIFDGYSSKTTLEPALQTGYLSSAWAWRKAHPTAQHSLGERPRHYVAYLNLQQKQLTEHKYAW